jgi:hypothetical protein
MENTLVAPYGVGGGHAGRTGRIVLNPGTPDEREVPGQGDGLVVRRGDLLRFETCGGGGWGDPLTRDPMRVRQDVARGFVSVRGAQDDYGVVLEPGTLEIDKQATDDERARRAGERPLIDQPGARSRSPLAVERTDDRAAGRHQGPRFAQTPPGRSAARRWSGSAEVVKVERPEGGDDARGWGPLFLRAPAARSTTSTAASARSRSI